ncbi:MAG TPA: hypothetical protein VMG12_31005 [Polyangiaceae bacterium]|nr:hypothetical protein [Polyangiaceae bacterium]
MLSTLRRSAVLACAPLLFTLACAPAEPSRVDVATSDARDGDVDGARSFVDDDEVAGNVPVDPELCAVQRIPLREVQRPIDIIMVLDNSISMAAELEAVERSINRNFADILDARGADYRVILLSRHRAEQRRSTSDTAQTSICVTQPLSSLESCPAPRPGETDRFFQDDVEITSVEALDIIVDTFGTPEGSTTQLGWGQWLREGSRPIFLLFTDDESLFYNGRDFTRRIMSLAPEHFGTDVDNPEFVFHSIIGVAEREPAGTAYEPDEPIITERCNKNGEVAASAGPTYQELSRRTGGLRYPLCALDDYGVIFEGIAQDGLERSGLACSFPLPAAPAGKRLDFDRIQLVRGDIDGANTPVVRVDTLDDCQRDAFYIDGTQIELCPAMCDQLVDLPTTTVGVEFDCTSFVDVR